MPEGNFDSFSAIAERMNSVEHQKATLVAALAQEIFNEAVKMVNVDVDISHAKRTTLTIVLER